MSAILTDQFRIFSAKQFIKSLNAPDQTQSDAQAGDKRTRLYAFIGRPQPWSNENTPPDPVDSFNEFSDAFDDMIALKRILASDVVQVVRRIDWSPPEETTGGIGFTYDMYKNDYSASKTASSGATRLYDADFYVVNSSFNVYKCIYNGSSPSDPNGRPSTVEPTGTSTSIITTSDGYRWKYLYTIPVNDVLKFFSNDYMPVLSDPVVSAAAIDGAIDTVLISSAGSGYNNGTYDNVPIRGDGVGGRVSIVIDGGKIFSVTVTSGGSGYSFGQVVIDEIIGVGNGQGGTLEVIIPPRGGHGDDPVFELGAYRVMVNARFTYAEGSGDFPTDNDFRRVGLVANPLKFGTTDLAADLTLSAVKAVAMPVDFSQNFNPDEIITQTRTVGGTTVTARGRVISWDSTTKVLKYYQNEVDGIYPEITGVQNEFQGAFSITGAGSTVTGTPDTAFPAVANSSKRTINNTEYELGIKFNSGYATPEIAKNSGDLIYIDNRRAIARSNDQIEDVKIVIEF